MADQNIEITIKDSTSSGSSGSSGTPIGSSSTTKTSATPADIAKVFGKSILSGHGIMGALKDISKISAGVAIGMSIFSSVLTHMSIFPLLPVGRFAFILPKV